MVNSHSPRGTFVTNTSQVQAEESSEDEAPQPQRRRRQVESEDESEEQPEDDSMEVDGDIDDTQDQVVKKLVRYALACEFQRRTIKRADIAEKGLQDRVPCRGKC